MSHVIDPALLQQQQHQIIANDEDGNYLDPGLTTQVSQTGIPHHNHLNFDAPVLATQQPSFQVPVPSPIQVPVSVPVPTLSAPVSSHDSVTVTTMEIDSQEGQELTATGEIMNVNEGGNGNGEEEERREVDQLTTEVVSPPPADETQDPPPPPSEEGSSKGIRSRSGRTVRPPKRTLEELSTSRRTRQKVSSTTTDSNSSTGPKKRGRPRKNKDGDATATPQEEEEEQEKEQEQEKDKDKEKEGGEGEGEGETNKAHKPHKIPDWVLSGIHVGGPRNLVEPPKKKAMRNSGLVDRRTGAYIKGPLAKIAGNGSEGEDLGQAPYENTPFRQNENEEIERQQQNDDEGNGDGEGGTSTRGEGEGEGEGVDNNNGALQKRKRLPRIPTPPPGTRPWPDFYPDPDYDIIPPHTCAVLRVWGISPSKLLVPARGQPCPFSPRVESKANPYGYCKGIMEWNKSLWERHVFIHLPDKLKPYWQCPVCKRTFARKDSFKRHFGNGKWVKEKAAAKAKAKDKNGKKKKGKKKGKEKEQDEEEEVGEMGSKCWVEGNLAEIPESEWTERFLVETIIVKFPESRPKPGTEAYEIKKAERKAFNKAMKDDIDRFDRRFATYADEEEEEIGGGSDDNEGLYDDGAEYEYVYEDEMDGMGDNSALNASLGPGPGLPPPPGIGGGSALAYDEMGSEEGEEDELEQEQDSYDVIEITHHNLPEASNSQVRQFDAPLNRPGTSFAQLLKAKPFRSRHPIYQRALEIAAEQERRFSYHPPPESVGGETITSIDDQDQIQPGLQGDGALPAALQGYSAEQLNRIARIAIAQGYVVAPGGQVFNQADDDGSSVISAVEPFRLGRVS